MSAAERMHRYYLRASAGIKVIHVELLPEIHEAMVADGWADEQSDRAELGEAVHDILDCWRRGTLKR